MRLCTLVALGLVTATSQLLSQQADSIPLRVVPSQVRVRLAVPGVDSTRWIDGAVVYTTAQDMYVATGRAVRDGRIAFPPGTSPADLLVVSLCDILQMQAPVSSGHSQAWADVDLAWLRRQSGAECRGKRPPD